MGDDVFEVNLHGLVGSTHNYGGLSSGNVASETNRASVSDPRAAFLQGLDHALFGYRLGLCEAVMPPQSRPHIPTLRALGFAGSDVQVLGKVYRHDPSLLAMVSNSSFMWTANAATYAPSSDTDDARIHLVPAALQSKFHRSIECGLTAKLLATVFNGRAIVHPPMPAHTLFGDEGAANHMRFSTADGRHAAHLFVYGADLSNAGAPLPARYPTRQTRAASFAVARTLRIRPDDVVFTLQNPAAIDAGVFHNDVISTNDKNVWLLHEQAYVSTPSVVSAIRLRIPDLYVALATAEEMSLGDAVSSYVFNSRIVSLPDRSMVIIAAQEARENPRTRAYLERVRDDPSNSVKRIDYLDLRQSMRNGGGPACLRLRMQVAYADNAWCGGNLTIDEALYQKLRVWAEKHYRDRLEPKDLADPALLRENHEGLDELTKILQTGSIYYFQ